MPLKKTILFLFVHLFLMAPSIAQRNIKDSLISVLKTEMTPVNKVEVLNQLAYQHYDFNDSVAFGYAMAALQLAKQIDYQKGIKYAYIMVGLGYSSKCEFKDAIRMYRLSEKVNVHGSSTDAAYGLVLLGNCYRETAVYDSAILTYRKALAIADSRDKENKVNIYKNLASISLLLWKNSEAIALLDSARHFLEREEPHNQYVVMDMYSLYGQAYKNILNYSLSEEYYTKMCNAAYSLEDYYHQVMCKLNQSNLNYERSNYVAALNYGFEALDLSKKYIYPPQYSRLLIQIGEVYEELSQYNVAAEYFFQALKITEQLGLRAETALCFAQLAWLKKDQHDYVAALQYANKSMEIRQAIGDAKGIANCHNIVGLVYLLQKKYDQSIKEHEIAWRIREQLGYTLGISASIFNISLVYEEQNQIEKALEYQKKCIEIEEKIDNKQSLAISYNGIAQLLLKIGRLNEALAYANRANELSIETGSKLLKRNNALLFSNYHQATGNYKKALEYQKLYQQLNDSIYSDVSAIRLAEVEAIYNVEKKEKDIESLRQRQEAQDNELQLQQAELSRKNWILVFSVVSLFLMMGAGFIGYRYYKEKSHANKNLKKLNLEIIEQKEEIQAQSEELVEASEVISNINKALEAKIEARTYELKQAYKELDTFFYRSSHDFRRPITTFLGLVGVAAITVKDPVSLELFDKVKETATSLDKMLLKLQSISDLGAQQMIYKEVFLKELVDEVLDGFRDNIHQKKISVHSELAGKATFLSYPVLIKLILENLVENSIHFSIHESPFINVRIKVDEKQMELEVEDNGQGILDEYQSRIFEMYFRANERSKGNGLGLYISKKAVERLNGWIGFSSEYGKGSIFVVRIPNTA